MATRSVPQLSLEAAQIASNAAQEKAKQLGIGKNLPTTTTTNSIIILPPL